MSAREEILARCRAALTPRPDRPPLESSVGEPVGEPVVTPADGTGNDVADPVALFVERVEDYRASVHRCSRGEVVATVATVLGVGAAGARPRVAVVPADLGYDVPDAVPDSGQTAAQLDRLDAVVTRAAVAIAETGTVVLDHGPGQGRRALSLIPDIHVCIVEAAQVVTSVPEAVALLDPRRPQTWISGPSATSDIELSRVEGVHGPRTLHVVLVEESFAGDPSAQ